MAGTGCMKRWWRRKASDRCDCPICFEAVGEQEVCDSRCGHKFHRTCLQPPATEWKRRGNQATGRALLQGRRHYIGRGTIHRDALCRAVSG